MGSIQNGSRARCVYYLVSENVCVFVVSFLGSDSTRANKNGLNFMAFRCAA